ncbi:hypothetical protein A2477_03795 [Candidatus Falkowbacteria bacterium RIFOXYC2_FULL_47_12]|uniref:Methyltransferase type 11 domain-containing protein n=2 Tax=Candidatus Falkowiibacteriota TaxID=1752728 RepID=A0A1F5TP73_9BACT|nr:MAG: hypothetical protein A2242_04400 [Candidatus Falkowbacteria bacterium RIFOXYA2_FULL_47_9]OGF40599.1 MAG: hypothetical protein A2477_03795 [Candidatus Falkowbacteria bacterium RIFOXYC2_FULL_47_12]
MAAKTQTQLWQQHFLKGDYDEHYPSEQVVRFLSRFQKQHGPGILLDLGCGVGRHLGLAAEKGFDAYGMDIAGSALAKTRKNLAAKGYKAHLKKGSLVKLPYFDNFFDIVISYGVFDHVIFSQAMDGVREVLRVLKNNGLIYFKLETTDSPEMKRGRTAGKNTRILNSACEKGITQHFFSLPEIYRLFKDFKILTLEREDITNIRQSCRLLSRWHVIAQKYEKK